MESSFLALVLVLVLVVVIESRKDEDEDDDEDEEEDQAMLWVGYLAVAVAVIWLVYKLYVAYSSSGGTVMVVVYDAAVYPPILGVVGLYLILSSYKVELTFWAYLAIWAVTAAVGVGAIRLMEEIGDKPLS